MSTSLDEAAAERARRFAKAAGRVIKAQLGSGVDGVVLDTTSRTAIKALKYRELYFHERDVYLRLRNKQVTNVCGFAVPSLIDYDDDLMVIEMDFVSPPYVLDFAGARFVPPSFPPDVMDQWRKDKVEQFEENWPMVQRVMREFQLMGIYLNDLNPKNINFGQA